MDEGVLSEIKEKIKQYIDKRESEFIPQKSKICVGSPIFDEKEIISVLDSLLQTNISQGKVVKNFENIFADYVGVRHAIAVNSGSSANLLALNTFIENGDARKGDEVVLPAATFATVAFPIIQLGLVPVFVDVDKESYNIDVNEIKKAVSNKTKIIMAVHSLGNPADMEEIQNISGENNIKILEDCCEAHGTSIKGEKAGSFGDMATLSFFVAHNITTGEGGMVFTNNQNYEYILRSLREFGRTSQEGERFVKTRHLGVYDRRYIFEMVGYNMRMTDIEASIGIEQFKKLENFNKKRVENANYFIKELSGYENQIQLPKIKQDTEHTFYAFPIVIKEKAPFSRQDIVNYLEGNSIETRPFFAGCLPDQPAFHNKTIKVVGDLPVSRWLRDNAFFIGCHPGIGKEEREYITGKLSSFLNKYN